MNNEQNFPNCMRAVTIICESTLCGLSGVDVQYDRNSNTHFVKDCMSLALGINPITKVFFLFLSIDGVEY